MIVDEVAPMNSEKVFIKEINSCFGISDFCSYIKDEDTLIIIGLQTNFCIDATVKSAFERGYKIYIPQGANSTFDNDYMTKETTYKYNNEFIWPNNYATCISIQKTIELMKKTV